MSKIGPLTPAQAKLTLAHRFTKLADNLRQLNTRFGLRPYRVFLIWTKWTGKERGEGDEMEVQRIEILPTPKVSSLDNVTFSLMHSGTVPVGSIRLEQVSGQMTQDTLQGRKLHGGPEWVNHIPEPYSFFYELVEDGRGDDPGVRPKFRLLNVPFRRAGKVDWTLMLERISEDRDRQGKNVIGTGEEG